MIKIVLHGYLKDDYPEFSVAADTVAEAVEAWSIQTSMQNLPFGQKPLIEIVGFDTVEKLNAPTDVIEIHLVPSMSGGGGSFGKILLGAALVAVAVINPGIGGMVLSSMGQSLFMSLGISLMLSGVMQLFMRTPKVDSEEGPEPSKILGAPSNTTEIGTLIPRGYGRCKVGGHYLSVQVNSQDLVYGRFPTTI